MIILIVIAMGISSFVHQKPDVSMSTIELIEKQYKLDFSEFKKAVDHLVDISILFDKNPTFESQTALEKQVTQTRLAYKKIEFLLEYLDPEMTIKYINGAPLPKLMKHVPEITVIEPNGLQTIDELTFLSTLEDKETIKNLSLDLQKFVLKSFQYQSNKKLEHRYVIEAIRYGVIRVFSLGITGFDTPGSGNALPEAIVSMQSMSEAFDQYKNIGNNKAFEEFTKIKKCFESSTQYLKENEDFDTFDRLHFLTEFVNPLYSGILSFQQAANIELKKEADPTLYPHNYESEHIFDSGFFNAAFYTQIAQSDLTDPNKIELGKMLFYDPVLSKEVNMSCASCHQPHKGFTDGLPKSKTTKEGVFTERHAPTLINSALYGRYFWDMREYDLERQIKHVVHNELEFNIDFIDLADRLKESEEYVHLFETAYGNRDKYKISTWSISNSLAAYVNSLTSYNSEFDQYARGETTDIAPEVRDGFNIFMGKGACGTCHFAPSFSGLVPPFYTDSESEVLGITTEFDTLNPVADMDLGRRYNGLAEEEADHYLRSIKTVTVRNAGITAPYMHNGSLETLEEVMHFYNHGGGAGLGLDIPNQTLPDTPLGLNTTEINNLIAFVESLTDTLGMTDIPDRLPNFEGHPKWNERLTGYQTN
ncbi:MAG: cytochrome c peroxidase [Bacteroidota bacterium]